MKTVSSKFQAGHLFTRSMTLSDLDAVMHVEELSFPHPWTREQFIVELERSSFSRCYTALLVEDGNNPDLEGTVVGFMMAWLAADELHITNLAVKPEVRRIGVAAALLGNSLREAVDAGATWCQLEVRASNKPARELYTRYGFEPIGTRKRYYQDGEDAVVMGKELGSS